MKLLAHLATAALLLAGCGSGSTTKTSGGDLAGPGGVPDELPEYNLDIPMVTYAWDPQAGDPSVPAELGGPGFTGEGWETNMTFPAMGVTEDVPQGGQLTTYMPDWPATLRMAGKDWNTSFNYAVHSMAYEGLLTLHPTTLEYIPMLATHWQISEDKTTYRFRINPEARWSNGKEVTAHDVVETWRLLVNPDLLFPSSVIIYGKLNEPKAISKYIVEVTVKEESWRNFQAFAGMAIFPAEEVAISGSEYLDKYQFAYTASSGPYIVKPEDIDTGKSITITRRRGEWWAENNPAFKGLHNIDRVKYVVVKEANLAFEMLKKGELDYMAIGKAQWWAEDLPALDQVQRGLLVQKKFFNDQPVGIDGIAINMSRPPLDDVRVRKALQHLYDRETMIEKLFYNEYEPLTSYWQGGMYMSPENELIPYDELAAVELLEEAGWTEVNAEGYRVKDGRVLRMELMYRSPMSERSLTVFQEAAKRAGIKIDLQLLTPAAAWKNLTEKQYDLASVAWGAIVFPNPGSSFKSELADVTGNNNVTAFKDPRVDELCDQYDAEYDPEKRAAIVREIDRLVYQQHPYVLGWYSPAVRVAYWNKFGTPEFGIPRFVDWDESFVTWWVDPEKEQQLAAARKDRSLTMEPGERHHYFWHAWNKAQAEQPKVAEPAEGAEDDGPAAGEGAGEDASL